LDSEEEEDNVLMEVDDEVNVLLVVEFKGGFIPLIKEGGRNPVDENNEEEDEDDEDEEGPAFFRDDGAWVRLIFSFPLYCRISAPRTNSTVL